MSSEGRTTEQEFLSSRWGAWEHSSPGTRNNHRVENVPTSRADGTQPYSNYAFFLLRREVRPAARVFRARDPRAFTRFLTTAFASFTARRTRGLAPAIFSVNTFCTDPAFAAMVPSVVPIDSATLVRMASSFAVLRLSMTKLHFSH